ncbi:exported hypothetical protein [Candidatus Sulfopaludibacter sp. SbA4]|nr:exported hypothetical protein [Candidatus Sulfopaludibacter sp. SbA4]
MSLLRVRILLPAICVGLGSAASRLDLPKYEPGGVTIRSTFSSYYMKLPERVRLKETTPWNRFAALRQRLRLLRLS